MTDSEAQRLLMQDEDYLEYLTPDLLVPHYLIHCHLYYECFRPIIKDHVFDKLARRLYDEWKQAAHVHRKVVSRKGLLSGGAGLKIPLRVQMSAESLWK